MSISVSFGPAAQGGPLDDAEITGWTKRACLAATRAIINSTGGTPPTGSDQATLENDPRKPWPKVIKYFDADLPRTPDGNTLVLTVSRQTSQLLDGTFVYDIDISLCFKEILEEELRQNEIFQHPDPAESEKRSTRVWRKTTNLKGPDTHTLSFPGQPWSLPWYTNGIKREDFQTNKDWESAMLHHSWSGNFKDTPRVKRACPELGVRFSDNSIDGVNSQAIFFVSQKLREIASKTRTDNFFIDRASRPEFHKKMMMREFEM